MASCNLAVDITGVVYIDFLLQGRVYGKHKFFVLEGLCSEVLSGELFLEQQESVTPTFGGPEPSLTLGGNGYYQSQQQQPSKQNDPPSVFANLSPDCHPVATKFRRHSQEEAPTRKKYDSCTGEVR